jgi:hypothetical protein
VTDVFISYSRRDAVFVRELHDSLTGAGRDVWVDWEDIPPASQWERDIADSIDAAESFLFVLSPSSLESEYCGIELRHAEGRGKRIVPVAIDGAAAEDAPPALRELNWIWCRETDDREQALEALGRALDTDLEWSRAHTRLLVRAVEWDQRQDASLLLRGKDLREVERQLEASGAKQPRLTELQQRYVRQSRRSAARRQRILFGAVVIALVVSIGLGVLALLQRDTALAQRDRATSLVLSTVADGQTAGDLDASLILGLEAYRASPTAQARNSLVSALEQAGRWGTKGILRGDTGGSVSLSAGTAARSTASTSAPTAGGSSPPGATGTSCSGTSGRERGHG